MHISTIGNIVYVIHGRDGSWEQGRAAAPRLRAVLRTCARRYDRVEVIHDASPLEETEPGYLEALADVAMALADDLPHCTFTYTLYSPRPGFRGLLHAAAAIAGMRITVLKSIAELHAHCQGLGPMGILASQATPPLREAVRVAA